MPRDRRQGGLPDCLACLVCIAPRENSCWLIPILAGCLLAICAGCSSNSKYFPSETRARQALEAALTAWRDGKKPGPIEGSPVPLQAVDSRWRAGEKLTAYEIAGLEPSQGPAVFSVRLTMEGTDQPIVVRYYVVGKDPLWVYREDDYNVSSGM